MTKNDLIKNIADAAYNVGFGAKKHFATYDITDKVPSVIGYLSIGFGIFALCIKVLSTDTFSAAFIVLGVLAISVSMYDHKKESYAEAGKQLTEIFNKLKSLYFNAKAAPESDIPRIERQLEVLEIEYNKIGLTDQILFSGWLAHYKFFWEQQIEWIDEQKHFRLLRDKLPLSFMISVIVALVGTVVGIAIHYKWL